VDSSSVHFCWPLYLIWLTRNFYVKWAYCLWFTFLAHFCGPTYPIYTGRRFRPSDSGGKMRESHRILQEIAGTGKQYSGRIFSGGFLLSSCAFRQEPLRNHREKFRPGYCFHGPATSCIFLPKSARTFWFRYIFISLRGRIRDIHGGGSGWIFGKFSFIFIEKTYNDWDSKDFSSLSARPFYLIQ
jgi:hypothetical protein